MSTVIWLKDPRILMRQDQLTELWPLSTMSSEEKVNAITRLVIFLTLIGYLLTLVLIGILYYFPWKPKNQRVQESFSNQLSGVYPEFTNPGAYEVNKNSFTKPTNSNPMMNLMLPEIYYDPKRKPAAPAFNKAVETQINSAVKEFVAKPFDDPEIKDKLFADLGDEITFNRSMLQYNATSNQQVPNDRAAFQDFCYGDMISAKEGNPWALERKQSGAYNYTMY